MKVLIIIPAYNESANIERVVDNLIESYPQYDYVVVNDGSTDNTAEICRRNQYNLIDLPVNIGLSGAVQTGMMYACRNDYDYTIQFDGDGQHNAEFIAPMLEIMHSNSLDLVIGSRFVTEKRPKNLRMLGSVLISFILKLTTGKTFRDPTSGMRMYNKKLIEIMANSLDFGPEPDTLAHLVRSGAKFAEVQVTINNRLAGESYFNAVSSIRYMLRVFSSIMLIQWFRKKPTL